MKFKNHFICIIVFIVISIFFIPKGKAIYPNLTLENIEALASGESGDNKCATHYSSPFCGTYTNNNGSRINLYYP